MEVKSSPERLNEAKAEAQPEQPETASELPSAELPSVTVAAPAATVATLPTAPILRLREIENVLSEGLDSLYASLSQADKQRFRAAGEGVARQIIALVDQGKASLTRVRKLIIKWLRLLPGVNRFFLEQEAKIKADRVLALWR